MCSWTSGLVGEAILPEKGGQEEAAVREEEQRCFAFEAANRVGKQSSAPPASTIDCGGLDGSSALSIGYHRLSASLVPAEARGAGRAPARSQRFAGAFHGCATSAQLCSGTRGKAPSGCRGKKADSERVPRNPLYGCRGAPADLQRELRGHCGARQPRRHVIRGCPRPALARGPAQEIRERVRARGHAAGAAFFAPLGAWGAVTRSALSAAVDPAGQPHVWEQRAQLGGFEPGERHSTKLQPSAIRRAGGAFRRRCWKWCGKWRAAAIVVPIGPLAGRAGVGLRRACPGLQ